MKMGSKDYSLADPTLWPNCLSLQQNLEAKRQAIRQKIESTKASFLDKNKGNLGEDIYNYLDDFRDIYYQPKDSEPSLCLAGLHYSIPDDAVGIGLLVDPLYESLGEFAKLYHGTKPQHLMSILKDGLRPGGGQAYSGQTSTDNNKIPKGVYFSFWMNQSLGYTLADNQIVLECYCKASDVHIVQAQHNGGQKGYTICNTSVVSRILIPTKKTRTITYY